MKCSAVVGAQWGDEGKGRVIDYLAQKASMVVRYQGGDNAGHTVVNEHGTFKLHLIPSGIFNPTTECIIGAGCVVNPDALFAEMKELHNANISTDNLKVCRRAHVVFPFHKLLDQLEEQSRSADQKIGTTGRGIGPAYADKAARVGLRVGDLLNTEWLIKRLTETLERKNRNLQSFGAEPLDLGEVLATALGWAERLKGMVVDSHAIIRRSFENGGDILLEGQLGVMKDLDWGTYPYVTSSNPIGAAACVGAGIPPSILSSVIGVVKAYSTSVGSGPFPVELFDEDGANLRQIGAEYGATTGRPRRCGWLDGVALNYAAWTAGLTSIAITKLDILDTFKEIKICTSYMLDGNQIWDLPDTYDLEKCTPVYETIEGWCSPTTHARSWDELPENAQKYVLKIADMVGLPISFISVGAERDQLILMKGN